MTYMTYMTYRTYKSYLIALYIDDALRHPRARFVARDFQLRVSGAFDLHGRIVPADVYRLSPCLAAKTRIVKPHLEARKEHPARRHLINQCVQPFGEQQFIVWRLAFDSDLFQRRNAFRVGDHRRQRDGGLLEGLLLRRADPANAHIRLVWKVLPICSKHNVQTIIGRKCCAGFPEIRRRRALSSHFVKLMTQCSAYRLYFS